MTTRTLGALCALLAALAFAIALAGGTTPKLLPGWWDGHPRIEGRVFERKDVHIGLIAAYGCNRGEEIRCQPLQTKTLRLLVGYIELAALVLLAATAIALMRSLWIIGDSRKLLGKAVLIESAVAVVGGGLVLALGPAIQTAQRFEVPIGFGMMTLWGGIAFATLAGFIAMGLEPEPLRLRSTQPKQLPPHPQSEAVAARRPPSRAPEADPPDSADPPTLPRVGPAPSTTRPPPIPAARRSSPSAPPAVPRTVTPVRGSATTSASGPKPALPAAPAVTASGVIGAEAAASPSAGATSAAPSTTAPPPLAIAGGDAGHAFNRGAIPPPLSAIPFWSGSPVPVPPPTPSTGAAPIPTAIAPSAPTVVAPSGLSLPQGPRQRPATPAFPTLIHAIPPPPSTAPEPTPPPSPTEALVAASDPAAPVSPIGETPQSSPTRAPTGSPTRAPTGSPTRPPTGSPTRAPTGSSTRPPTGSPTRPPTGSPIRPPTGSPTRPPTASDGASAVEVAAPAAAPAEPAQPTTIEPVPPAIDVPISTAPASLPPPKKAVSTTTGPAPACPQCETAMAWVEEHLRFYCAGCRMYF